MNFKDKPTENTNLITRIGLHIKDHWDYKLNEKNPEDYFPSSNEKVWWKCPNGHSYLRKKYLFGQILDLRKLSVYRVQYIY